MKLAIASDLHLEFADIELKNDGNVDMLVLAGDICVVKDLKTYMDFFRRVSEEFPRVLYVMGNHEHYNGDYATTYTHLKEALKPFSNIYFLEKDSIEVNGYTFVAGTMWTDMNEYNQTSMAIIGAMMNDFKCVRNSNRYTYRKVPLYLKDENGEYVTDPMGRKVETGMKMKETVSSFSVDDAYNDHKQFLDYLDGFLSKKDQLVVVTHHAPSGLSTPSEFAGQYDMNGGYRSHLDHLIEDHPNIKLWIHGHMHDPVDYTIGKTRVFSNPRGYLGYETNAKNFVLKTLEL
jgi:Icc-related predicted phosphoesterase